MEVLQSVSTAFLISSYHKLQTNADPIEQPLRDNRANVSHFLYFSLTF